MLLSNYVSLSTICFNGDRPLDGYKGIIDISRYVHNLQRMKDRGKL